MSFVLVLTQLLRMFTMVQGRLLMIQLIFDSTFINKVEL